MKQIVCLSHSPWQARPNRTQQLLTRLNDVKVLFFEPPLPKGAPQPAQQFAGKVHRVGTDTVAVKNRALVRAKTALI